MATRRPLVLLDSGQVGELPVGDDVGGASGALGSLSDVVLTTPADGYVLTYQSSSGTWIDAAPTGGSGTTDHAALSSNLAWTTSGHTGTASRLAGWDGSNVATTYQIGTGAGQVAAGDHTHTGVYAAASHAHAASDITSGTVDVARLPVGTTSGTVAAGDHTHATYTLSAVVPSTAPAAGQVLAGNSGGTAYAPVTVSGSGATISLASTGVMTISGIANTSLANSSVTVTAGTGLSGGGAVALGGSVSLSVSYGTTAGTVAAGDHTHTGVYAAASHTHAAADVTSGTFDAARIPDLSATYAAASHAHGNITSAGAIGSTANLPVITTTSGVLTVGAFGTSSGQFAAGDHTHAQLHDAVTIADSTTIDLTLSGQQISAAAIVQMSITSDASGLKLSGDSASPGNSKLYGTNGSGTKGWYDQPAGGSVSDGDKGDITVSSSGATWTIDNGAVTLAKMANLAQDKFIVRTTASTGVPETATCTAAGRALLDDVDAAAQIATLGFAASGITLPSSATNATWYSGVSQGTYKEIFPDSGVAGDFRVTVPSAGTWIVAANVRTTIDVSSGNIYLTVRLYNVTDAAYATVDGGDYSARLVLIQIGAGSKQQTAGVFWVVATTASKTFALYGKFDGGGTPNGFSISSDSNGYTNLSYARVK